MDNLQTLLVLLSQGEALEVSWRRAGFSSCADASQALERLSRSLSGPDAGSRSATRDSRAGSPKDAPRELEAAIVHVDGASRGNPGPSSIGVIVYSLSGEEIFSTARTIGNATNNVAEYRAVLEGVRLARDLRVRDLTIRLDSELVARQLDGRYRIRNAELASLARDIASESRAFARCRFEHVPREQNKAADRLANEALNRVVDS